MQALLTALAVVVATTSVAAPLVPLETYEFSFDMLTATRVNPGDLTTRSKLRPHAPDFEEFTLPDLQVHPRGGAPIDWFTNVTGTGSGLVGAAYGFISGANRFVVCGEGGKLFLSTDCEAWVEFVIPGGHTYNDIEYGNGVFVAVASLGIVDRIDADFNVQRTQFSSDVFFTGVAHESGSNWGIVGSRIQAFQWDYVSTASTDNGGSWATAFVEPTGVTNQYFDVGAANGVYVACTSTGRIRTSPDGFVYTDTTADIASDLRSVAFGSNAFVVVGDNGSVRRSTDNGNTWMSHNTGSENLWGVSYGGGYFTACSSAGGIRTSPTGTSWTPQTTPTSAELNATAFGGGRYIAVGQLGTLIGTPIDADLAGFTPAGWAGQIVVANIPGTSVPTSISEGDTVYIDYAYANFGNEVACTPEIQLTLDGTVLQTTTSPDVWGMSAFGVTDLALTGLPAGTYTFCVDLDTGMEVSETDETNNEFCETIHVAAPVGVTPGSSQEIYLNLATPRPSPSAGDFELQFDLPRNAVYELALYDVAGRRIRELAGATGTAGRHSVRVTADVPSGVYFVRLRADGETRYRRVVISR